MKDTCAKISRNQSPDVTSPDELNGIKRGSTMVTFSPNKVASIAAALTRLSERWDKAIGRAQTKTAYSLRQVHDMTEIEMRDMPAEDRRRLGDWFMDRYNYLQEEYRLAINEADNVIGKQWLFDLRPKLNKELP